MIDTEWSRNTFWGLRLWVPTLELRHQVGRKSQPTEDHRESISSNNQVTELSCQVYLPATMWSYDSLSPPTHPTQQAGEQNQSAVVFLESSGVGDSTSIAQRSWDSEVTVFRDLRVQRSQGSEISGFRGNRVQRSQGIEVTELSGHRAQRSQGSEVTGFRGHRTQRSQGSEVIRLCVLCKVHCQPLEVCFIKALPPSGAEATMLLVSREQIGNPVDGWLSSLLPTSSLCQVFRPQEASLSVQKEKLLIIGPAWSGGRQLLSIPMSVALDPQAPGTCSF